MSGTTKDRIFGLDILRCLAILFVLLSHTSFMLPVSETDKDFYLIYFGFTGVEFFFILSGYLVGTILLKLFAERPLTWSTLKYFWIRRWFRTLPAYYLALLLYVGFYYYLAHYHPVPHPFILEDPFYFLFFVFLQNFVTAPPEFFRHSWSLSVEEWFYLLTPLWIILFHKYAKRIPALTAIIAGIVLITLLRLVIVLLYNPNWNLEVRAIVPLRLDSLMVGVLMAYIHLNYKEWWRKYARHSFVVGLLIFIGASIYLYLDVIVTPATTSFFSKTFFFNVFSIAIALWMPGLSLIRKGIPFIGPIVTHISIVSYSLYLIHFLIINNIYLTICYKYHLPNTLLVKFWGSWAACIIGASIMYWCFEKPFTNVRERFKLKKYIEHG
jgi:peptidoglycan/LPS O-acetylase OafA/YrhL